MTCTDLVAYRSARDELRAALAADLPPERRRALAEWVQSGAPYPGAAMRTPITLRLDDETLAALDALAAELATDPRARALAYGGRVTRQDAARYALQRGLEAVGQPAAAPAPDERPRPKRTRKPAPSAKPEADAEDPELASAFVELESRMGTLQAVADELGVDLSSVSRWRSGARKPRRSARAAVLALAGQ